MVEPFLWLVNVKISINQCFNKMIYFLTYLMNLGYKGFCSWYKYSRIMQHNFVVVVDWCHTETDLQVNVVCRSVQYLGARKTTFVKLKTKLWLWVALYSVFPPLFVTGSLNLFERMKTSFYQRLWLDPALSIRLQTSQQTHPVCAQLTDGK